MKQSIREQQVGGSWYKTLKIEPIDFITKNNLDWYSGNIVKYLSRHKLKGGQEDIKKVVHYALMLLEDQYGIKSKIEYDDAKPTTSPKRVHRVRRKAKSRVQGVQGIPNTNIFPTLDNLPAETPET